MAYSVQQLRFLVRGGLMAALKLATGAILRPLVRELTIATDTKSMRVGDGTTEYVDLPVLNPLSPCFQYKTETGSTADSDPTPGLLKWNNATQAAATFLYFDDNTADTATDLSTLFATVSVAPTGLIHIVLEEDRSKWQVWEWSSVVDATGYWKFGVTLQAANGGNLGDNLPVRVTFSALSSSVSGGGGISPAIHYGAETGAVGDSDPGNGLLRWNNATQASATILFLDDLSADGVSLASIWPTLGTGGFVYIQHETDEDIWQIWEVTGVTDAAGYAKLAVSLLAKSSGDFADNDPMLVTLQGGKDDSATVLAAVIHAATGKTTPVDADELALVDSAASNVLKKLTWANLKATMWTDWGAIINAGTGKTTPVDADLMAIADSAASNATKKLTWANAKATLKTYFDTLYGAGKTGVSALTISSGVVDIDCNLGPYYTLSLTANVTSITFSNLPASGSAMTLMVRLKQDGTGSRSVALPASFKKTLGSDTAVQAAANAYTILALTSFDQGTRWEYTMAAGSA